MTIHARMKQHNTMYYFFTFFQRLINQGQIMKILLIHNNVFVFSIDIVDIDRVSIRQLPHISKLCLRFANKLITIPQPNLGKILVKCRAHVYLCGSPSQESYFFIMPFLFLDLMWARPIYYLIKSNNSKAYIKYYAQYYQSHTGY